MVRGVIEPQEGKPGNLVDTWRELVVKSVHSPVHKMKRMSSEDLETDGSGCLMNILTLFSGQRCSAFMTGFGF